MHKHSHFVCFTFTVLLIGSFSAWAALGNFQQDLTYANSLRGTIAKSGAQFNPQSTFKDYTANPEQTQYFGGVTQKTDETDDALKHAAMEGATNDPAGSIVVNAAKTREAFQVDRNASAMQKGDLIQSDAHNISRGISDQYVNCEKTTTCQTTFVNRTCDEAIQASAPRDFTADNNCQALRAQGCQQTTTSCRVRIDNRCVVQDETYRCAVQSCTPADDIVCGDTFYCMDGHCSTHDPVQNKHFDQAITGLAAIGSASDDIEQTHGAQAFSGTHSSCRKIGFYDFSNCCADRGWGQDLGLAHCSAEEKALGQAKEKQLTGDVGFHCDKHYLWPFHGCRKGHEVYCVFRGRLAAIVQTQGRYAQLGINFGDADSPNCRGLTPEELSRLDLARMDFSSLYQSIKNNTDFPNSTTSKNKIAQRIHDFYERQQK